MRSFIPSHTQQTNTHLIYPVGLCIPEMLLNNLLESREQLPWKPSYDSVKFVQSTEFSDISLQEEIVAIAVQ